METFVGREYWGEVKTKMLLLALYVCISGVVGASVHTASVHMVLSNLVISSSWS